MSLAISVKFSFVSNMGLQVHLLWLDMQTGALMQGFVRSKTEQKETVQTTLSSCCKI